MSERADRIGRASAIALARMGAQVLVHYSSTVGQVTSLLGAMALIVCPARVWAASDAQLEQRDAPPSATAAATQPTALQRIIDSPLLHPQFTMNWRSYGLGSDADGVASQHTWATGGRLGITFPAWRDWLSWLRLRYADGKEGSRDLNQGRVTLKYEIKAAQ